MSFAHASPAWWLAFNLGVLALLALDLGVFQRRRHAVGFLEALAWSVFWVALALGFYAALLFGHVGNYTTAERGPASLQFLTAYLVEKSLSLDNLFVFAVIFQYFKVDAAYQHGVLFWGVLGALVLRGVMIIGGLELLQTFEWVLYLFGALLLWSAWKLWGAQDGGVEPQKNPLLQLLRRAVPMTARYDGAKFFTRENGRRVATPLLAVLIALETSDVLFAVDSVPAVLGVTRDPFLAYTSNIFAILGLRTLYFLLAGVLGRFWMLHYALALLLAFIGGKMLLAHFYEIPLAVSLTAVCVLLGGGIAGSLLLKPPAKTGA